jgi:hypothetical protein
MKKSSECLDNQLRKWGQRCEPDTATLHKLEERVMRNTRECLANESQTVRSGVVHQWFWQPKMVVAFATVSILLVLGMFAWKGGWQQQSSPCPDFAGNLISPFDQQELAARQLLFGEMEQLFAGAVRWVKLTDDDMQFDLATEPIPSNGKPVALRTVVARQTENGEWEVVWKGDVMLPPDEYVAINNEKLPALGLWVHRLPDGAYVVNTDIGEGMSAGSEVVPFLPGGSKVQSVCLKSGQEQYRLTQSLAELSKGAG